MLSKEKGRRRKIAAQSPPGDSIGCHCGELAQGFESQANNLGHF